MFASDQKKGFGSGWVKKFQPIFPCTEEKKIQQDFYKYVCLSLDESYE